MSGSMNADAGPMQALFDAITQAKLGNQAERLFHGRGGLFPGCEHLALDFYPPVLLLTSFQPLSEGQLDAIGAALASLWAEQRPGADLTWVYQERSPAGAHTRLMAGAVPEPHEVAEAMAEGEACYRVHLLKGQNHGLFLDMAAGRRWVYEHLQTRPKARVLNLFAYTCAFSVVALQAGARQVVNVDMSSGALAVGQQNHRLNGLSAGASFLPHDVFSSWGKLNRLGPYDLVIADPPTHQKGSFVADKDYPRLMRRLPDLLAPGGHALLCLNAPNLGLDFLQDHMRAQAPGLAFVGRVANPPAFADASDDRALKVLVYRSE